MTLELKNDLSELKRLSDFVTEYCSANGHSQEVLFALNLSLEEVVANVISYGFEGDGDHLVTVTIDNVGGIIEVQVGDNGRAFNPLEQEAPDLDAPVEERPIGGLGIHLVRHYMDSLEYMRLDGRNILKLKKSIS